MLLHVQYFDPQQSVSIHLRGIGHHGRHNVAFGFYGFVGAVANEIGNGLPRMQFGEQVDAFVACTRRENRKNKHSGGEL